MPSGMTALPDGTLLFGEYWRNPGGEAVKIYRLRPTDKDWQIAYTFLDHRIRHIHAVQADPYELRTWVATGDSRAEPALGWTEDAGNALHVTGSGEPSGTGQKWRICQLIFTPDALYWGADTESSESGIYRYDRHTGSVTNLAYVPGATWFGTRLADATIVLSSAVQNYPNEIDKLARLWIVNTNDQVGCIHFGTYQPPKLFGGYGWLRFPHNQGAKDLYLTGLNIAGFNGDLLAISSETLKGCSQSAAPSKMQASAR